MEDHGRSPLGLRGLKSFQGKSVKLKYLLSQPTRAAWIEITGGSLPPSTAFTSQPTRAAWIEIEIFKIDLDDYESQPTRAAWIEICKYM